MAAPLRLVAQRGGRRRYVQGKRKPKLTRLTRCGLLAAAGLAGLRVKRVLVRTPVLLPHFDRQAVESQLALLAVSDVLRLCQWAGGPTLSEHQRNASRAR